MGYFTLKQEKNGQFAFTLHSSEGTALVVSDRYDSKDSAENGIDSMRTIASFLSRFNHKRSNNDQHYFVIKTANDQVLGTSKMYDSLELAEKAIETAMQCAPVAKLVDETTA